MSDSFPGTHTLSIPWFGARKMARELLSEVESLRIALAENHAQFERLGALPVLQLENYKRDLERETTEAAMRLSAFEANAKLEIESLRNRQRQIQEAIVRAEDVSLLQESGIYEYHHPLADSVAYQSELKRLQEKIKAMNRKDGGAIFSVTTWTVNGSEAQGRAMVRDISKLMLRAFNAEADSLVRGLKPYKVAGAVDRLTKVALTIERLGKSMQIRIAPQYQKLRIKELELTGDYLQMLAEEKERERAERERLREERKVQQEIERERVRLEKERQHYANALEALIAAGDEEAIARMREQLENVDRAIQDVDYRAANIRAGYVYVVSNIGSFGDSMVKVGMTRRLDPLDRIRELSGASVPFNFDVHALFFSNDAVGIEAAMHERLADTRVNLVNKRREFFRTTPLEAKVHLSQLAGDLLQFEDVPEAVEYRQSVGFSPATA